jgi:hypothetical protein
MYHAKKSGKNTYSVYSDEMSQEESGMISDEQLDRRQFRR